MRVFLFAFIFLLGFTSCAQTRNEKKAPTAKAATPAAPRPDSLAVATFAGGCFWCTEEAAEKLRGVYDVISGYTGGTTKNPTYAQISTGQTGHAEAVQIHYDPKTISYETLLEAFFAAHDPTTLNRQGPDEGTQYRSAIFYRTPAEKAQIEAYIQKLNAARAFQAPIVTEVAALQEFYPAEAEHQDFYRHNPDNPYMRAVSTPKVEKFKKKMAGKLKEEE
ncbi:peptide-methionine (S)-S-oxide reductase MsrA [Rufibacter glacialis]|uniref:Peptide methionine sulfoxide reductase MsrA n=1 Tax=Rufibacter glacialis TaxID=1259555 RepID=A0A5M8Q4C5_9BACT|nr:peptide-methionine (S)-S-oxide reductase MsrA [Rufibacter glacialis]KAA6430233.1 peptide-methionine (S)-S-oxide reductase MsrA [Rufibacter glacialis]GGK87546.1 peptide methionine sulfoxide reductase MsrA [Rufibacter glacialis]